MTEIPAGIGFSVPLASLDFETYSEAGFDWDGVARKWRGVIPNSPGLEAVGAWEYAVHPSARVICASWDLRDGAGVQTWRPGDPDPVALFDHVKAGGKISAHNAAFEMAVWALVCVPRYGWPIVDLGQWRCNAAKARAWGLPGSLGPAAVVLGTEAQKDKRGEDLIARLSVPQNTRKGIGWRYPPADADGGDYAAMAEYNRRDVAAEMAISDRLPELTPFETEVWRIDQKINARGCAIDWRSLEFCRAVADQETERLDAAMVELTGGAVPSGRAVQKLTEWLKGRGLRMQSLDADAIDLALLRPSTGDTRRALEIRRDVALSSVSKINRIFARLGSDDRVRGLFLYHGCSTARWSGIGPQPQNLPAGGPAVKRCPGCGAYYGAGWDLCFCGLDLAPAEWGPEAQDQALDDIRRCDPDALRERWGCSPLAVVSGCLRGLFVAAPGFDLIGADFSAIEAVVLAALAGEDWRLEVFRTHGKIYEMSAAKILGLDVADFDRHKAETGSHHPKRKLGKVAELASGYQGGLGAWRSMEMSQGVDLGLDDDGIRAAVRSWRKASPAIVAFWGGLWRRGKYDPFGCEGAAVEAVRNPGACFAVGRGAPVSFGAREGVLYCRLPSGRCIVYQDARVYSARDFYDRPSFKLIYKTWGSRVVGGKKEWVDVETYGGALTENICQAVARDLQAAALVRLDRAGYPAVLHVHDEIVAEVRKGTKDAAEFRAIMATLPDWAAGWPLRVGSPWRGFRFRK